MQPIVKLVSGATAAVVDSIAEAQALTGAELVTLNGALVAGGVAVLPVNETITITSVGDDSGISFTIIGKDQYGNAQTEILPGENAGVAETTLSFSEVTEIVSDGATADDITVGNSGMTYSDMIALDPYVGAFTFYQVSLIDNASMTWTVQGTLDNPNDPVHPCSFGDVTWFSTPISNLSGQTNTQMGSSDWTPLYVRLRIAGTGQARFTIVQLGAVPK